MHEPRPASPARITTSPPSSSSRLPSSQITSTSLTSPAAWASPAFLRRKEERFRPAIRPAFTAPADPLPFSTDEIVQEELDSQKPRKRTKFGRKSGEWKFTQEEDAPDYAQHDLTGTFDVEMIEREIDAEEGRKTWSPARVGQEERRTKKQDRWPVADFGLDGSSASRPRPFVEAEGFERIVKESVAESRPALSEPTVTEDANIDEDQAISRGSQDAFSTAPEHVVADTADSTVDDVQAEGSKLSNGSIHVLDEEEDRGDKTSIASRQEPPELTEEGENDAHDVSGHDHAEENEHDMNNEDGDEDEDDEEDEKNAEDEDQDDTNDNTNKDEERIQQEEEPEEQQSQTIANEEQEITTAQPQISAITATEEVSQANAQLHAELASQLEEHGFVNEDLSRTDETMQGFTAPQHQEEDLRKSGEDMHADDNVKIPSVIPETLEAAHTLPDTMDQDVIVAYPTDLLNVAYEDASTIDVSPGPDTSSVEQTGINEETADNTTPIEKDPEAELPIVVNSQLDSVNDAEPDGDIISQHAADDDAHDEAEKITYLEANASPVVANEDEPSKSQAHKPQRQPAGVTMMQAQDHISRSVEHVAEPVLELAATVEAATAIPPLPNTELDPQSGPEHEAQSSPDDDSLFLDGTGLSMEEPSHQEEATKIEDMGESQIELTSDTMPQHEEEASETAEDTIQVNVLLEASEEPVTTSDLPEEDVTTDTMNDIELKVARLEAMTDDQLLQEGQSQLDKLIEEDGKESQTPFALGATSTPMLIDIPIVFSDELASQEPPAHRLSAFEVVQSRLNRPVKQTVDVPAFTPDGAEQSEGSSSEEEVQEDEKQPSLVINVLDDSTDPEDNQVEYDDVPSVAEAASPYGSKGSEESFTGFDDEEQLGPDAAAVDQDSVIGSAVSERADPERASFEEEPFAEFQDEEEDEDRPIRDLGRLEEMEDENERGFDVQTLEEDMEDAKVEARQTSGTAEKVTADDTLRGRLQSAETENDRVDEEITLEEMKNQEQDNGIYDDEDGDEDEVLPELDFKLIPDLDTPLVAALELKSQAKDHDIYEEEDEDDVLPELDFSQIPALEKPLVAGLSAINDPALEPFGEEKSLPALKDQVEGTHTRIAEVEFGLHHDRGNHAAEHIGHKIVNGHSTHDEAMPLEQAEVDIRVSKREKKSSNRKSNVPSELKGWFSPRESLQDGYRNEITPIEKEVEVSQVEGVHSGGRKPSLPTSFNADGEAHGHRGHKQQAAEPSSSAPVAGSRQVKHSGLVPQRLSDEAHKLVGGLHTSLSYYTPLTDLQIHTNSQHEHDSVVDVLAVVSSFTAKAKRATSGPKDHFTTFHITTPTSRTVFSPVEVQVFRPRKEVLPLADVGDVALLRNFVVRSNNGKSFLLSTAASAWCVWRYAKKERLDLKHVGEECLGPPVEIGGEERQRAQELSSWWKNEK